MELLIALFLLVGGDAPLSPQDEERRTFRPESADSVKLLPPGATDLLRPRERSSFIFGGKGRKKARSLEESRDLSERKSAALQWLALHQNPDGSWSSEGFRARCSGDPCSGPGEPDYDVGVTGLAVLAFLGSGVTPYSRELRLIPGRPGKTFRPGEVLKKALQWLISQQDLEGAVGPRRPKYLYGHALATMALSEAYGMTQISALREPAQNAVDFLVAAQNPGQGWRYSFQCRDNDTSVTGWAVQALRSAESSGLTFPMKAYEGALAWINAATRGEARRFQVSYREQDPSCHVPTIYDLYDDHPAMTAVGLLTRLTLQVKKSDPAFGGIRLLIEDLPDANSFKIDYSYWFLGSLALYRFDGPSGPTWTRWDDDLEKVLLPLQKRKAGSCVDGSWDPTSKWGIDGGRVWATSLNALTLLLSEDLSTYGPSSAGRPR